MSEWRCAQRVGKVEREQELWARVWGKENWVSYAPVPLSTWFLAQATKSRLSEMSVAETLKSLAQARLRCLKLSWYKAFLPKRAMSCLSEITIENFWFGFLHISPKRESWFLGENLAVLQSTNFCHFSQLKSTCTHSTHDQSSVIKLETHIKPFFNSFFIIPKGFTSTNSKSSF